jgi:hypothetical protein
VRKQARSADRSVEQNQDLATADAHELAALIVDRTIQLERTAIARVRLDRPGEMARFRLNTLAPHESQRLAWERSSEALRKMPGTVAL